MKLRQSSLDIYAFFSIYREIIEGSFIKKIYEISKGEFVFQIYRSDAGKRELFVSLTKGFAFREIVKPEQPSPLAMILRKYLSERRIVSVEQINFDRVVCFHLSNESSVIFELFREGNLIINQDGKISYAMIQREWRNRRIRTGEYYIPPSSINPLPLDEKGFSDLIHQSKASVVQTLATRFNLGGEYSEELLFRAGIDKNLSSSDFEDSAKVHDLFLKMLHESCQNRAFLYRHGEILSPVQLTYLVEEPERTFSDLNEGFSFYFENYPENKEVSSPVARRIESQRKTIEEYSKKSQESREIGSLVMANLTRLQDLLSEIRRREKEITTGLNLMGFLIEDMDRAVKEVTIRINDRDITLKYDRKASENANEYFSRAKDLLSRIEGAKKALEESIKALDYGKEDKKRRRVQKYWFESYNWFISSEDFLVIAGKDRKTNERIVKKHMGPKDIYVHADLYGAPSTIIKAKDESRPGELTIREACQFAVSHSRAWNAGLVSGSAYWVYPEQVSKTPESGEYVSTGSWIVRGKRNYLFDLPLSLDISIYPYRNDSLVMCYPSRDHKGKDETYVTIRPGEEKRQDAVKRIAAFLGVDKEEIDPLLPSGGFLLEFKGERDMAKDAVDLP